MNGLLESLTPYRSVAIIGMEKNVGKTTTMKGLINDARGRVVIGITSVGRDGESRDLVTGTEKPRVYIAKGTVVATAKSCLKKSDFTKEILETTGIMTPLGEVIIARALTDGYVELAGPSRSKDMKDMVKALHEFGCQLVVVDGALSRKSSAMPQVTEAVILATGAVLGNTIDDVVDKTRYSLDLLMTEEVMVPSIRDASHRIIKNHSLGFIYKDGKVACSESVTALGASKEIIDKLEGDVRAVVIKGVLVDTLLNDIMKNTRRFEGITFVVTDGTKLFINKKTKERFERKGGSIAVLKSIKVAAISLNPQSPKGTRFEAIEFLKKMKKAIPEVRVYDIVGCEKNESVW